MSLERLKRTVPLLLGDMLTLFCLLAGGLGCVLPVNHFVVDTGIFLTACALFSIAAAALHTWRYGSWVALGLLGIEALVVWGSWEDLGYALWLEGAALENQWIEFFLLAFALALLLGWVVIRARCWYLAALMVIVPILPAITGGTLPNWTALTAATLGWGTMLLTAFYNHQDTASLGKGVLLSMGALAALLLALTIALPQEGYTRPQWATDARNNLVRTVSEGFRGQWEWELPSFLEDYLDIDGILGSGGGTVGSGTPVGAVVQGSDGAYVDLRSAGPRRYSDRTVLEVEGGAGGWTYLWGGSAAIYTGEGWEDVNPEASIALRNALNEQLELGGTAEPVLFPALTAPEVPEQIMTIRHASSGGETAYYPYRPAYFLTAGVGLEGFLTMGIDTVGESRPVKERKVREYQIAYRPGGPADSFTPLGGDAALAEEIYRNFVYENYLDVPQAAQEALMSLSKELDLYSIILYGLSESDAPDQWRNASAAAQRAASLLAAAAEYDLDTPAMAAGEDFVAHFLREGRGYCVHFATAGAMLLRMNGIPARYASGYAFRTDAAGAAQVKDSAAHAWVEIYLDGYGWYPVEMTPGYRGGLALPDGSAALYFQESDDPQLPEEPDEPPEPDEPNTPDEPEDPEAPNTPEPDTQTPEATTPDGTPEEKAPLDLSWLRPLGILLLAAAIPPALYRFGMHLRRRSRDQADANRSVIDAYIRYRRLLAWGGGEEQPLEDLARKARFSQHTLTTEERESAWGSVENAKRLLDGKLPWWKRAAFRCLGPIWF